MVTATNGTFIDRLLDERETLQDKQEKLCLFLGQGAPGVSPMQRYLLPLQLCAMTMYGDILDRRLEDLGFPTGDLEPFYGPELDNVGMDEEDETSGHKTTRVASEEIGEPRETGGHDEDRDGPIPFGS